MAAATASSISVSEELCRVFNASKTPTSEFPMGAAGPASSVCKELANPGLEDAEFELVCEFRAEVEDVVAVPYWHTAAAYWRFLVARKLSLVDAVAMYRAAMSWRAENGIDTLLETYREPPVLAQHFPSAVVGADRDGFPLLVERIGAADLAGLGKAVGPKAFLEWVAWYHERQEAVMRRATELATEAGKDAPLRHKMTVIVDLEGIGMRHLGGDTISVLRRRTALEESCYPEVVRSVYIVRAPAIFAGVWTVVRAFVDAGTRAKMALMSSEFLPVIRERVDDSLIPAFIGGGYAPGGDEECTATIGLGGVVQEPFMVGPSGKHQPWDVPAGATIQCAFVVPGGAVARLQWRGAAGNAWAVQPSAESGLELLDSAVFASADDLGENWAACCSPRAGSVVEGAVVSDAAFDVVEGHELPLSGVGGVLVIANRTPGAGRLHFAVAFTSSAWMSTTRVLTHCQIVREERSVAEPADASKAASMSD